MRSPDGIIVTPGTKIGDAVAVLDAGRLGIALVCDAGGRLCGIVTDVDIRKGLLRGLTLDDPVETIMCVEPCVGRPDSTPAEILALMHRTGVRQIPIVERGGLVLGVEILKDLTTIRERETEVVVMAGGRGRRLRPLTEHVPKPMLPIGGRPLLEILVERLQRQGFTRITLVVNYMADVIERHFGDGERFKVRIRYLRETEERGSAGSLFALAPRPTGPFILINGDLLTELSFERLVDFHAVHDADLTLCLTDYRLQVPFGVIDFQGEEVLDIREKPTTSFSVSAGIYVVEPRLLDRLPSATRLDMPELVKRGIEEGLKIRCFPLREKWVDIGTEADYRRALESFQDVDG